MGKSKIVKDMSLKDIVASLKGYKAGTYGDALKGMMMVQVKDLSDSDIDAMSLLMKVGVGTQTERATKHAAAAAVAASGGEYIDLNEGSHDDLRIEFEDLGNRNTVSEEALGLRKTDLYQEVKGEGTQADYDRPAAGTSTKFERAYQDAPPMVPHSVEGMLPITTMDNQCLGCHLPEVAPSVGATAIPVSHFTNYRPATSMKGSQVIKEGQILGVTMANTSDIVIAETEVTDTLYQGRFNCSQCHAPQSKMKTAVANTFTPDFENSTFKGHSSLSEAMNDGVDYVKDDHTPFMESE